MVARAEFEQVGQDSAAYPWIAQIRVDGVDCVGDVVAQGHGGPAARLTVKLVENGIAAGPECASLSAVAGHGG